MALFNFTPRLEPQYVDAFLRANATPFDQVLILLLQAQDDHARLESKVDRLLDLFEKPAVRSNASFGQPTPKDKSHASSAEQPEISGHAESHE